MDGVTSVNKEIFRRYFIASLCSIGIDIKEANVFCTDASTKKLSDFGICHVISQKIDDFMMERVKDYKGCMPSDNWKKIVEYNFNDD
ncbi:MAG: hypothetical protein HDQ88_04755 [Clostridia bacterium]|nr:hypothetical protein [Clostridia bacterium]